MSAIVENVLPSPLLPSDFNVDDAFRLMLESVVDYALFMLDPHRCVRTTSHYCSIKTEPIWESPDV
jgi:hypothetical protein